MVWFEVFMPAKTAGQPNITLTVEAQNWIGALRTGLSNLGEGHEAIANVMCDIKEDNSIHVTDVSTRRVFRLREVPAPTATPSASASASPPPEATRPSPAAPPRPVSMPEIPRDMLDDPLGDATIPNPIAVGDIDSSIPWTKMSAPTAPASPTVELKASMPPPASKAGMTAPKSTQMMFRADVKPPDVTLPDSPPPQPPVAQKAPEPKPVPKAEPKPEPKPVAKVEPKPEPKPVAKAEPKPEPKPEPPPPSFAAPKTQAMPDTTPKKKKPEPEPTERLVRPGAPVSSPPSAAKTGPVAAPTPRGTTAPPPKRASGQFEAAPRPTTRETSVAGLGGPMPVAPIGRQEPVNTQAVADAVADVFDATQDLLMEAVIDPKAIAERLLDIALEHIPAESGSFFLADVNGHELHFAAVRGPKASEIQRKKLTVKVGQGIVGFCALEGVCLSVSDIQKDPRYFSAVADAIGYSPKDTLCASAEKEGRLFGALQIINSKGGFTPAHMEVLRYIGLTAASLLERHFDTQ